MCGICGLAQREGEPVNRDLLWRMTLSLSHRGPDDQNVHLDGPIGLGHCRLSIIDLEAGKQPFSTADGRLHIIYNGEVYNYLEIREELEGLGETFRTTSDTEVVLLAYRRWGPEAFGRFSGMFALAIWDETERELILARDRFGMKPLFYMEREGRIAFASEIKVLRHLPWWDGTIDPYAVDEYFSYLVVAEPRTIYQAVRVFPPSHWGKIREGRLEMFSYWEPEFAPRSMSLEEACAGLDEALRRSVKRCLRSDVPVGGFLSGGLDSAGVVSYAAEETEREFQTFSIGFTDEPSYNELPLAKAIAAKWGTTHHELDLRLDTGEIPALARRVSDIFDQPYADYSAIPQLKVAEFAVERMKTVLSGDGGDEILGGYQTVYAPALARLYRKIPAILRRKIAEPLVRSLPTSTDRISFDYVAKRFIRGAELPMERAHFAWKEVAFTEDKPLLYTADFLHALGGYDAYAPTAAAFARCPEADEINRLLYVDQRTFLLNDNLPKVDRTSMAVSLEVRVPLLNNEVVDFMLQVPSDLKVRPFKTKYLYRQTLASRLPAAIVRGKKKGFTAPIASWLKKGLYDWASDMLQSHSFQDLGIVSSKGAMRFLEGHRRGEADHNRLLWCCLMLALWAEGGR